MKKKILIGLAVVALLFIGFSIYNVLVLSKRSPSKTTTYNAQGLDIKVVYCQPSKRARLIFGEEKDGALQPYGKYWRRRPKSYRLLGGQQSFARDVIEGVV